MASEIAAIRKQNTDPRSVTGDEAVYRAVYDAILAHKLPPGTKLAEDSLGEVFGVSRTVIRKALFRLSRDNIVEIRPNRGAVVASPSVEQAREVFQTRRILEKAVIENLLGRISSEQIDALRNLVDEEEAAFSDGDRGHWIRLSGDFHIRLAEHAGNGVIVDFLRELVSRTSLVIAIYETPGNSACSFDEHRAIIGAIASGDSGQAIDLMNRHLQVCEQKLKLEAGGGSLNLNEIFAEAANN
ncbi:MAG: GntR family transcriptional regulator [Alphaproteobacteria bacterium]|nr:GntR family transcriptional regulator [Alphaproteobacteria bacterium]